MKQELLRFEDVSIKLGGRQILSQVSFSVFCGEHISIIGKNGAGKTTVLRCAMGVFLPDSGRVYLAGRLVSDLGRREIARQMAYVPQQLELPFPMTVWEFVLLARYPHLGFMQAIGAKDEKLGEWALDLCGALDFAHQSIQSLSGGERQRMLIAAALVQQPQLLLLDEVCHFLDPQHESEVLRLLSKLNQEHGVTIVSVTHDINQAAFHSSRVLALRQGGLVFDGAPEELMQNGYLERIYGKQFVLAQHPQRDVKVVVPEL